ncbi:NAD dependent epimerase/dehydratase family protein [Klebsiella pneumoniae]|nr:NAD dependent epimerase/dehydratase family protein [Klebsiella pneumoniae]
MSQSVLVLGASGYIGQHLVRALSARGYPVLAAARHIDRLQKLALPGVTCRSVDLNQPQDLPALLTGIDTFIIWSTAWAKAVILSPMSGGWRRMCAMPCVSHQCAR